MPSSITEICKVAIMLCSPRFNPLHSITNEEHYKKDLCNQSSHNRENSCYNCKEVIMWYYRKSTHFVTVSEDKWDTNEDTGKYTYTKMIEHYNRAVTLHHIKNIVITISEQPALILIDYSNAYRIGGRYRIFYYIGGS